MKANAPTPETLMRSRYTAFALGDLDYIERTMLGRFNKSEAKKSLKNRVWTQLIVLNAAEEGDKGTVQFTAFFKQNKQDMLLHEISTFKKIDGKWYYVDGESEVQECLQHVTT